MRAMRAMRVGWMRKGSCCDGCGCGGSGSGGGRERGGNDGRGLGEFDRRNIMHSTVYLLDLGWG